MSNKLTTTNINPTKAGLVDEASRYAGSDVIYYGDRSVMTYKTYKKQTSQSDTEDKFTIIPAGMEYRPDLMSYKVYGLPDFWWKILEANNIKDIYDFKAGLNIRLPANVY